MNPNYPHGMYDYDDQTGMMAGGGSGEHRDGWMTDEPDRKRSKM